MSSWHEEYTQNLNLRDKREKRDYELIDAYTRLADRTAALEAGKAILGPSTGSNVSSRNPGLPSTPADVVAQLKSDLAEALRSKGQLQSRLRVAEDELEKLRTKSKADNRIVKDLHAERAVLMTKVKDRDEELRGKAKLLEDVQDEILSLNLQLNMSEERSNKLKGENNELIDRWMQRMGQEADAMNNASKFS